MASSSSSKNRKTVGRYVDPTQRGRLTPKVDRSQRTSPSWYGWVVLDLLAFGLVTITLNYLQELPGAASPWYLVVGLVSMFGGFFMATNYR
jgi:FtsH-binding integral membrane protein